MSSNFFLNYQVKRREVLKSSLKSLIEYEDVIEVNNFEGIYESTDKAITNPTLQDLIIKEED